MSMVKIWREDGSKSLLTGDVGQMYGIKNRRQ